MKNPHRRVAFKISHSAADCLLLQLSLAYDHIKLLYGDSDCLAI